MERLESLAGNYRPDPRVRFNAEDFGFIVGFPDGRVSLVSPEAVGVLHEDVGYEELLPYSIEEMRAGKGFHLRTPVLAWLELTKKCNLSCPHCYIDAGHARTNEMPTSRWLQLLDEMAAAGVWAVAFTGGEPTLHKDFVQIVNHARSRDLIVGIATHGMFLGDLLDQLPQKGVIISVSIDDLHFGSKGKQHPTELAKQSLLKAIEKGFLVNVMTNTHRLNTSSLPGLIEWSKSHGISVRSVPTSTVGRGKKHPELQSTNEELEVAAKFWLQECLWEHEYHKHAGICVGSIFNYGLTFAYLTQRCASARYLCYIASDGTMFPCTMCAGENIFPTDSVAKLAFSEVWRKPWSIRQISWSQYESVCAGCPINNDDHYCTWRCPAMSTARHGVVGKCGASDFEIQSTLLRTELLSKTDLGSNIKTL